MAGTLALEIVEACAPEGLARLGGALLARMGLPGATPTLLCASLDGEALLLGRHQREASAVRRATVCELGLRLSRRMGGGRTIRVGGGTMAVLLGIPPSGGLSAEPVPADRVLNRYVRGLLAGLTMAGVPAGVKYFGRDFLTADHRQLAVVSHDGTADGAVLIEAVVATSRELAPPLEALAYPAHSDARAAGPPHVTLSELAGPGGLAELADALARGHAKAYGCRVERRAHASPEGADLLPLLDDPVDAGGFAASGLLEVPIGFVEAFVRLAGTTIGAAHIRGDFLAPGFAIAALESDLAGCTLDADAVANRVQAAFDRPHATLQGITSPAVLTRAVLAAAHRA